jgi:hypothetical protein
MDRGVAPYNANVATTVQLTVIGLVLKVLLLSVSSQGSLTDEAT